MKNNQKGFSVIEGLIIAVVILAIAGAGFYVYKKQKDEPKKEASNSQTEKSETSDKEDHEEEAADSAENQYLVISEWGIKLKLDGANRATYQIVNEAGENGHGESYSALAKLELVKSVTTNPDCQDLGLSVFRATEQSQIINSKKIGDYYYYITGGPGSCGDATADEARTELISQLNTPDVIEQQ